MTDDECIHGLTPATCAVCKHGPKGVLPARRPAARVIEARFRSHCPRCGQRIEEGQPVGLVDDTWICCYEGAE